MFKKAVCILLSMAMMIGMLASCDSGGTVLSSQTGSSQSTVEKKDYTLKVWAFQSFSAETDQRIIDQIQKFSLESGINVVVETIAETTFTTKFNAALEAGALPDVIEIRNDTLNLTYPNIPFVDMTEISKQIETDTGRKFVENLISPFNIDGKIYAVPFYASAQPAVFRTDLYGDTFPTTWDELCEAAIKVSDPDNGVYGLGIGCGPTDNDGETALRMWIWSEGGYLFDKDGNPDPVNAGTIKVVQKYVDMYNAGAIPPAATTWDAGGNNNSYLLHESAVCFNPFTVVAAMKKKGDTELEANTSASLMPSGSAGHFTSLSSPAGWAISKNSKYSEDGQKLITYLCEKDWYNDFMSLSAPLLAPTFEDTGLLDFWQNDPYNKIMIDISKEDIGWFGYPCTTVSGKKAGALVFNNYLLGKAITRIITEKISVEDGLAQLKKDMETLLAG